MATAFSHAHAPDRSPIAISNFDKQRYVSAEWMERERTRLWATTWLVAGVSADLREPGQFITFDIGAESIIVARGSDGMLRAMHNACTHRGTRLVTEPHGLLKKFVCPYHAWIYGLDGSLESVPGEGRFSNGVPKADLALKPVEVEESLGMVFVRLTPGDLSLADFLAPLAEAIGTYRLDLMDVTNDQSVSHLCNWKAIIDNFAELYHVPFLHPIHRRMFECATAPIGLYAHGHTAVFVEGGVTDSGFPSAEVPSDMQALQLEAFGLDPAEFRGRTDQIRPALQRAKRALAAEQGLSYDGFTDAQLTDVWQFNLFPNVILSVTPESAWLMRSRPDSTNPGCSHFDMLTLVRFHGSQGEQNEEVDGVTRIGTHFRLNGARPADFRRPSRDSFTHEDILAGHKTMTVTIDEDISLLGRVQQGMASSGFERVWLSDEECRVQHYHNTLDACLGV
ncbi:aromatic ring-hydroxylating oxygenase subunit alpha [Porphyrobacter sp. LM 6]|uniref:aromatic ring-hydroxylating oxygenase subunit alpha n=1 Tax=Porphyrobacter sp. LM 6 TaxID=1896196 RepID=UPI00084754ED|nr:aromatic ring-hydroxylating dioxygenase subunit alpha [Porphyrobacter sp. LM 6]AOL94793.1 Rieske [2Fe-2S] domain-containing protein [Porphyrobacter sp. LM 6]